MKIELISITHNAEKVIEKAGRTAYQSFDKITDDSATQFISRLIKMNHESVLEHATATFLISGISRSCSHQLVRHRIASYTQKSQRYCKSDNFDYIIPESIKNNDKALEIFINTMKYINNSHKELEKLKIRNEDSRFILPEAVTTEIIMTTNFREWRHIIKLRTDPAAQWEIRMVALKILEILKEKLPSCFGDL